MKTFIKWNHKKVVSVITTACLALALTFNSTLTSAEEEHGDAVIGPGKAVEAVRNDRNEFKISKSSLRFLNVKFINLQKSKTGIFVVPNSSVVTYRDKFGIYVTEDSWLKLIEVKKVLSRSGHTHIYSPALKPSMMIVSEGAGFVRITHVHLTSKVNGEDDED